jgi:hypothetical protein
MKTRRRSYGSGIAIATASLCLIAARHHSMVREEPPYRIAAIRAMLFYTDSGTFSPDLLSYRGLINLWNVPANQRLDHEIGGPSNATLVIVEIRGRAASYVPGRQIDFRATTGKKVLSHQASDIYMSAPGVSYAAFWLSNTGCESIRLSARVIGQADTSSHSAEIPFHCGE